MSYIKREGIPVEAGEIAVELDTGELVAVGCGRSRVDSGVEFHARARVIVETGASVRDANGKPIVTEFRHAAPVGIVDATGADVIARDCMLAVMGEPVEVVSWGNALLAGVSIRVSLAAAQISGPVDAGGVL